MSEQAYAVILVYSTSYAIRIERLLNDANINCKLIPVPRQLSSDCGVCVRFCVVDKKRVLQLLQDSHVEFQQIYDI